MLHHFVCIFFQILHELLWSHTNSIGCPNTPLTDLVGKMHLISPFSLLYMILLRALPCIASFLFGFRQFQLHNRKGKIIRCQRGPGWIVIDFACSNILLMLRISSKTEFILIFKSFCAAFALYQIIFLKTSACFSQSWIVTILLVKCEMLCLDVI